MSFNKIADAVIPMRGDSPSEIIRKIIFLVSLIAFIISSVIIAGHFIENNRREKENRELQWQRSQIELTGEIPLDDAVIEEIKEKEPQILDEYIAVYERNPDVVGWIEIPNAISYPVLQAKDNDFYLYRDIDKNYSVFGSIFADCNVPFTAESRPNNTILYGHNISSVYSSTYFARVTRYYPQVYGMSFYNQHPTINFDTIYEKGVYKIFAGIYINTKEEHGAVYDYYRKRSFPDKESFYDFAGNIMDRSVFYTDVDLEYGDEIITLSTCYPAYNEGSNSRFALFARRVREDESSEVDVSKAYVNPSPLYFDYYYRVNGGSWQGRNWDTSKVIGFDEFIAENPDAPIALNN